MPRFKLDESLPASLVNDLRTAGYDATRVLGEGMSGSADPDVLSKCQTEGRVLVTLDRCKPACPGRGCRLFDALRAGSLLFGTVKLTISRPVSSIAAVGSEWSMSSRCTFLHRR
jgi:hypothetical protein